MSHSVSTAERIKEAALGLFLNCGYDGASLSAIAKEVGIKTPSIYAHFPSKDQLFLQLFDDVIAEDGDRFRAMSESMRDEPVVRQLRRVFDYYADNAGQTIGQTFLRQTFLLPPRHLRDVLRTAFLAYEREVTDLIVAFYRRGMEEGVFRLPEEQMIALLYAVSDGLLVERQIYDEELFESRKQMAWESLLQLLAADREKGQDK